MSIIWYNIHNTYNGGVFMSCLKNCIYSIRQQINRVEGELLKLEDFAACKKKDAFHNKCIKISNLTSILYSMTESLASNADTYFMDDVFSNKKSRNVYIKEENNEVIILLPELLPHRPRYDINTNKMKYDYDITEWKEEYIQAFEKKINKNNHIMFHNKVMVSFIYHMKDNNENDIDALDTKQIIDIITLFYLPDDSKDYVCYFIDSVPAVGEEYTEIRVKEVC